MKTKLALISVIALALAFPAMAQMEEPNMTENETQMNESNMTENESEMNDSMMNES